MGTMDSPGDVFLSDSVEPEIIAYSIEDCIIPGFHPPQPLGKLWPEGVPTRLIDVSTALVYLTPGLLAICTVGNLVSGIVLRRLYPGVLSTGLYVLLALFMDTLVVWSRCGLEWMRLATNTNLREIIVTSSLILCKICPFLSNTILQLSSWLMVAMAAETAWVHQHPQRLMRVCRTGRARLIILAAIFVAVAVNCPNFWTFSLYTSPSTINYDPPTGSLLDEQMLDEKPVPNPTFPDQERPTCANEITDERLVVAAAASWTGNQQDFYPSLDYRKMLLMSVDLLLTDMLPYFTIFSCAVMLVTKRLKRKDQVRQIDNTWKACNIDSGVAHQLHSTFICLCLAHTVLLFPKLVYKTFLLVTDPQVTGLVPYPVVHRPCTVVAKAVCYLLHYAFLSGKVFVLLASSTAFRGECLALVTCNSTCDPVTPVSVSDDHVTTGLPLLQQSECTILETTSLSVPSTTSVSTGVTSSRTPPNNYIPHPPLPPTSFSHGTLTRPGKTNHVVISSTLPLHHTPNHHRLHKQEVPKSGSPKPEDLNAPAVSSAAILENGAPCIKIFSMTSV